MKFLIDAQLPRKLSLFFNEKGFEAIHTLDLIHGNKTTDTEIIAISMNERYVVITKDIDFWDIYKQKSEPYKLIYLTVGNLSTVELLQLFNNNMDIILQKITESNVIEINRKNIVSII